MQHLLQLAYLSLWKTSCGVVLPKVTLPEGVWVVQAGKTLLEDTFTGDVTLLDGHRAAPTFMLRLARL